MAPGEAEEWRPIMAEQTDTDVTTAPIELLDPDSTAANYGGILVIRTGRLEAERNDTRG